MPRDSFCVVLVFQYVHRARRANVNVFYRFLENTVAVVHLLAGRNCYLEVRFKLLHNTEVCPDLAFVPVQNLTEQVVYVLKLRK